MINTAIHVLKCAEWHIQGAPITFFFQNGINVCLALKFLKIDHCDSIHSPQKSARMWVNESTFLSPRCYTDGIQIYKDIKLKITSVPSTSNLYELVISDRLSYTCTNAKLTETKLHVQP